MVIHWQSLISPTDTHICTSPPLALPQAESKPGTLPSAPSVKWKFSWWLPCPPILFIYSGDLLSQSQKYRSTKGRDGSRSKSLSCKGSGFIFTWAEIFFFFKQDFKIPLKSNRDDNGIEKIQWHLNNIIQAPVSGDKITHPEQLPDTEVTHLIWPVLLKGMWICSSGTIKKCGIKKQERRKKGQAILPPPFLVPEVSVAWKWLMRRWDYVSACQLLTR